MDDQDKIQEMLKEGKISSDQAALLIKAMKESEERKKRIFQEVSVQKQKRQRKAFSFLLPLFCITIFFSILCLLWATTFGLNRDQSRALEDFQQANQILKQEKYKEAIDYYQRGIKKAPKFFLGYSLLGMNYQILYEQTSDQTYKDKAKEAFQTSVVLQNDIGRSTKMNGTGFFFLIVFCVLILGVLSVIFLALYNVLVKREEGVNQAWGDLVAFYQRKCDLIPALLNAVKDFAGHENDILETVTQIRSQAREVVEQSGDLAKQNLESLEGSQMELDKHLRKICALAEQYPDLKASVNYVTIQHQLEYTEDEIARARQEYNNQVNRYNTNLRAFPLNLMAALFQFQSRIYFEAKQTKG